MSIHTRTIEYKDGDVVLEAYVAWEEGHDPKPGVLISHAWGGRSEFEQGKAEILAELGYVGFALDLYGKGVLGTSREENSALMQPLLDDRAVLQRRMQLALAQLKKQKEVDGSRVAAMGFCFGGLCVLDLARTGADVCGVASVHGLFKPPGNTQGEQIKAKVLVLHGWDDPMATPDQVLSLAEELTTAGADWQIHGYGNTVHAFSNPAADDPAHGTVYDQDADRRSWQSLQLFFAEIF
ncbi:MAG: dienelactone hydrolase family protein [Woeseiaceae bacterium]